MTDIKNIKNINDELFPFRVEDERFVSVLAAGYIITPDGEFIDVRDEEDHASVFSNYIRSYLDDTSRSDEDTIHALISLTKLNHIAYMGIKMKDKKAEQSDNKGYGVMVVPDNMSSLTEEQKRACLILRDKNKSIFGNRKIMDIEIYNFNDEKFTEDEFFGAFEQELREKESQK